MTNFKLLLGLLLGCFCCSCSLIRDKSLQAQQHVIHRQTENQERSVEKLNLKKQVVINDSSSANFSMLIKPVGVFRYTEKDGFNGNAEYVLLRGQSFNKRQTLMSEKHKAESMTDKRSKAVEKQKDSERQTLLLTKKIIPNGLYCLLLLPLAWLLYQFRKQIFNYLNRKEDNMAIKIKVYRSAITGKFIKKEVAEKTPKITVKETVKKK